MSEQAGPIQRPSRPTALATAQRAGSADDPLLQMQAMLNQRPQVAAQAKFNANPATQSILQTQAMLNQRPQVVAQAQLAADLSARSRVSAPLAARPVPAGAAAPVQAKFDWESNSHLAADPEVLPAYLAVGYQDAIKQVIDQLPDDADADDIKHATERWLDGAGLANTYRLIWTGPQLYLFGKRSYQKIEFLGTYYNDQSNELYLKVPEAGNLYVKKSDGTEWSRDSLGKYLPRYLTRSVDDEDTDTLDARAGLSARDPRGHGTKLEHVSGLRRSQYSSYTRSPNDVMNAQGGLFNAAGRGRVKVDLANIAQGSISDLSTPQGARGHLRAGLNEWGRENFDEIVARAQTTAAAELRRGPGNFAAAGTDNPFRRNITDSRWQAMVDVFRTQEVLIEGDVPHEAVLDYTANTAPHVRPIVVGTFRNANQADADDLTTAGEMAKTAHEAPLPIDADLTGVVTNATPKLDAARQRNYNQRRLPGANADENRRNQAFDTALGLERRRLEEELTALAQAFQHRRADHWPNTTTRDFLALITQRAQRAYGAFLQIAVPA